MTLRRCTLIAGLVSLLVYTVGNVLFIRSLK